MYTEHDENKGLVKVYWEDIRERVMKVEPVFAKMVDELSPDKNFPLFLAYYPYGEFIGDTQSLFLPKPNGGRYKLSDPSLPKDINKHLGYGKNSAPLGMLLDKTMELFVDLTDDDITIPWSVYMPGSFISFVRNLSGQKRRIYTPNGVLSAVSGTRTAFMLPHIGCATHHSNLQRDFNVQSPPPKSLFEHWHLFKEIIESGIIECNWRSCVIYFSEKWVEKIQFDEAWLKLKMYLHDFAWQHSEYERSRIYYDIAFSLIQKKRNLKPNPYLVDTARHLFATAIGAVPGYAPACSDNGLPLEVLQKVFVETYGLKKYYPTIMQPVKFDFEKDKFPVYYSLQNPTIAVFSPKSRKISSTIFEMRELEHVMKVFVDELSKDNSICSDTIINSVAKNVQFKYFHNEFDRHHVMKSSEDMVDYDKRLKFSTVKCTASKFSSDARFVRGCISMVTKGKG